MKVVASNIFDFTSWYKFGYRFIPTELIIELDHNSISGEELLNKTGYFEEDYEVFFLELPESLNSKVSDIIKIALHDVVKIIPITDKGGKLLSTKIPDFRISPPISAELASKLFEARNRHLAISGGQHLFSAFGQIRDSKIIEYQDAFMNSLFKYFSDLNAEQDSVLDYMLFYERSKPYPLNDMGFLFDIGGLARTRFNLTDDDFKNRGQLQIEHPEKFDLVEEVLSLSKFIQNKSTEKVWKEFLNEYSTNENLKKLSLDLSIIKGGEEINNILVIALYLKFRYLIRNTTNLDDGHFTKLISQFLQNVPIESKIALYLVGMFFGALKFKELYYKYVPLAVSRFKYQQPISHDKIESKTPKPDDQIEIGKVEEPSNDQYSIPLQESAPSDSHSVNSVFDEMFWEILAERLPKLSKDQKKIIKESYFFVLNYKETPVSDHSKFLINVLKKRMKNSKAKKLESKLTIEIIETVQSILNKYFPNKQG